MIWLIIIKFCHWRIDRALEALGRWEALADTAKRQIKVARRNR